MLQAHDGSWWLVFHGYRKLQAMFGGVYHILGRETCLAPVSWPENGWPVVNGNGTVPANMTCPTLPLKPFTEKPARTDFDEDVLGLDWNYLRYPENINYSLSARKGYLRLTGTDQTIEDRKSPTFTGRRMQHPKFTVSTLIDFQPAAANEEAGIILLNNGTHFDLIIKQSKGKRVLVSRLRFGNVVYESKEHTLKPGPVKLVIKGEPSAFTFLYSQGDDSLAEVQKADPKFLSSETAGGFTGVYAGLYATGNGKPCKAAADFDWFEYVGE